MILNLIKQMDTSQSEEEIMHLSAHLVTSVNQMYSPKELGCIAEKTWQWCSFPQPVEGSFIASATKVVEASLLLEGVIVDSVDLLTYNIVCLIPIKEFL